MIPILVHPILMPMPIEPTHKLIYSPNQQLAIITYARARIRTPYNTTPVDSLYNDLQPLPTQKHTGPITAQELSVFIRTALILWLDKEDRAQAELERKFMVDGTGIAAFHTPTRNYLTPWRQELVKWHMDMLAKRIRPPIRFDTLLALSRGSKLFKAVDAYRAVKRRALRAPAAQAKPSPKPARTRLQDVLTPQQIQALSHWIDARVNTAHGGHPPPYTLREALQLRVDAKHALKVATTFAGNEVRRRKAT